MRPFQAVTVNPKCYHGGLQQSGQLGGQNKGGFGHMLRVGPSYLLTHPSIPHFIYQLAFSVRKPKGRQGEGRGGNWRGRESLPNNVENK